MKNIFTYFKNHILFKNIFKLSFLQVVSSLLTVITLPILANTMELFFFGLIIFIQIIIKYFHWIVEWGFYTGGVQTISSMQRQKKSLQFLFNEIYSAQITITILLIPILIVVLNFLISDIDFNLLELTILILYFISSSCIPVWFFNGMQKVHYSVIIQIYPKIFLFFAIIFLINQPNEFIIVFLSLIVGNIIGFIQIMYLLIKRYNMNFSMVNPLRAIKNYLYYFLSSSSLGMTNNMIPLILGMKTSVEIVGIFAISQKIMSFISLVFNPILSVCFPRICDFYTNNQSVYHLAVKKYSLLLLMPLSILLIFLFIFMDDFFQFFFISEYTQSVSLFTIVIPAILINMINSIMYYFMLIPRQVDKPLMKYNILNFILTTIVTLYMVSLFGVYGAAYSLIISEIILLTFYLHILKISKKII